jgi:Subtilisin inhibitor-like
MTLRSAAALVLVLALVGPARAATPAGSLKITYWPHGLSGAPTTWTLRCRPAGGTHPAARLSCRALASHAVDLEPASRPCTLMPTRASARATIKGSWAGRRVERSYRIGCPGWRDLRIVLTGK